MKLYLGAQNVRNVSSKTQNSTLGATMYKIASDFICVKYFGMYSENVNLKMEGITIEISSLQLAPISA